MARKDHNSLPEWYSKVAWYMCFLHNRTAPLLEGAILNLGIMGEDKRGSIEAMFLADYGAEQAAAKLAEIPEPGLRLL